MPVMGSPLPDSSQLEAGILEDEKPSRLSRVQENVRILLRGSIMGSIRTSSAHTTPELMRSSPRPQSPSPPSPVRRDIDPHPTASPSISPSCQPTQAGLTDQCATEQPIPGVLFPEPTHQTYSQTVQQMAHQSALFNTRAAAAINHPDLSDASVASLMKHKAQVRQQKAWKRPAKRSRHGRHAPSPAKSQCMLSVLSGLLLAALVATYVALVGTSQSEVTPTFHILFILGIILSAIVFAHTVLRVYVFNRDSRNVRSRTVPGWAWRQGPHGHGDRRREHHHHHHHPRHNHSRRQHQAREMPSIPTDEESFVPATPIRVHFGATEDAMIHPDTAAAVPSASPHDANSPSHDINWDKPVVDGVANPPPAYGRWRGSVRANPDLLHWQALPSPIDPMTPAIPSPTYAEAQRAAATSDPSTAPPSYITRDSPERQREVRDAGDRLNQPEAAVPEMVEIRLGTAGGVGIAM